MNGYQRPTRSPGETGPRGFLHYVRDAYQAGHLARGEWLARVWLHGRIIESKKKGAL